MRDDSPLLEPRLVSCGTELNESVVARTRPKLRDANTDARGNLIEGGLAALVRLHHQLTELKDVAYRPLQISIVDPRELGRSGHPPRL